MATREGLGPEWDFCFLFRNSWLVAIFQGLSQQLPGLVVSGMDLQGSPLTGRAWPSVLSFCSERNWVLGLDVYWQVTTRGVILGTHPYYFWLGPWGTHLTWFGDYPNGCIRERTLICYIEQLGLTTELHLLFVETVSHLVGWGPTLATFPHVSRSWRSGQQKLDPAMEFCFSLETNYEFGLKLAN